MTDDKPLTSEDELESRIQALEAELKLLKNQQQQQQLLQDPQKNCCDDECLMCCMACMMCSMVRR